MRLTKKAAILKILMVLSGVFCFADIHSAYEEAVGYILSTAKSDQRNRF